MRVKTFISTLSCIAIMACGTAFAQQGKIQSGAYKGPMAPMANPDSIDAPPFYTNFVVDPCTSCNYSADNGYLVLGPNNCGLPGSTQWLAYPFVASRTGAYDSGNTGDHQLECLHTDFEQVYSEYQRRRLHKHSWRGAGPSNRHCRCFTLRDGSGQNRCSAHRGAEVLGGSCDLTRTDANCDNRGLVGNQYCLVGLQPERW